MSKTEITVMALIVLAFIVWVIYKIRAAMKLPKKHHPSGREFTKEEQEKIDKYRKFIEHVDKPEYERSKMLRAASYNPPTTNKKHDIDEFPPSPISSSNGPSNVVFPFPSIFDFSDSPGPGTGGDSSSFDSSGSSDSSEIDTGGGDFGGGGGGSDY